MSRASVWSPLSRKTAKESVSSRATVGSGPERVARSLGGLGEQDVTGFETERVVDVGEPHQIDHEDRTGTIVGQ